MELAQNPTRALSPETLVSVSGLTRLFPVGRGLFRRTTSFIHAVDDVSFSLDRGDSLGLVGESGCGKTTVGKLLVKLLEPTSGEVVFRLPGLSPGAGPLTPRLPPRP